MSAGAFSGAVTSSRASILLTRAEGSTETWLQVKDATGHVIEVPLSPSELAFIGSWWGWRLALESLDQGDT
jgi:hypothetical protein